MKVYRLFFLILIFSLLCGCGSRSAAPTQKTPAVRYVALTFDDGPYTPVTNSILDTLEAHHARATFFVVGNRAEVYTDCVQRAYALGCEIGNHTYSHADLCGKPYSTVETEICACSAVIEKLTGEPETLFRPTGGKNDQTLQSEVGRALILWSVDTRDWAHHNSEKTVQAVLDGVTDGSIVLMHDLEPSTAAACKKLIPALQAQGYQLVTVSELLAINGMTPQPGKKYYSAAS